jgi:hypothetical protein
MSIHHGKGKLQACFQEVIFSCLPISARRYYLGLFLALFHFCEFSAVIYASLLKNTA